MLQNFQMSDGLLSRYSRLLCKTVLPFQEAVLNDRVEGVAPSHAIHNFRREAAQTKLIPYFMWGNRGLNEMRVWLPVQGG